MLVRSIRRRCSRALVHHGLPATRQPLLARGFANHLPLSDPWKLLGITRSADLQEIKKAYKMRALQTHPDQNPGKNTHVEFHQVKKAFDLVSDLKMKELAGESNVAQEASGVLPVYSKELEKNVEMRDWETGWETWEAIQAMDESLPPQYFGQVMTNVFKLCYGDHEANRLYVKKRAKLADLSGEGADATNNNNNNGASDSAKVNPVALIDDDDWVSTSLHVIHDAIDKKTVEDTRDALEECFTKLLWVAKDNQDVDSANKINDAIVQHGLPASIAQVTMQELYREVYHTRGV